MNCEYVVVVVVRLEIVVVLVYLCTGSLFPSCPQWLWIVFHSSEIDMVITYHVCLCFRLKLIHFELASVDTWSKDYVTVDVFPSIWKC